MHLLDRPGIEREAGHVLLVTVRAAARFRSRHAASLPMIFPSSF
jgi:hypothetical protein